MFEVLDSIVDAAHHRSLFLACDASLLTLNNNHDKLACMKGGTLLFICHTIAYFFQGTVLPVSSYNKHGCRSY